MPTLADAKKEALENAIDNLARYKFMIFGYWSAIWVHLNNLDINKEPNPFRSLVECARNIQRKHNDQSEMSLVEPLRD